MLLNLCTGMFGQPFTVGPPDFIPGVNYNLSVSATDEFGQLFTLRLIFVVPGKSSR